MWPLHDCIRLIPLRSFVFMYIKNECTYKFMNGGLKGDLVDTLFMYLIIYLKDVLCISSGMDLELRFLLRGLNTCNLKLKIL